MAGIGSYSYKPIPSKPQGSGWYELMGDNWQVSAPDYSSKYQSYYDTLMGGAPNYMNYYNSLLGQTPDLESYMSLYGGSGLGAYDSALFNQLTGTVSTNLASPGGGAINWAAGAEQKALQELADQYAGWGRGTGVGQAAQAQTLRDYAKTRADYAVEAEKQSIADALALEELRASIYGTTAGTVGDLAAAIASIYGTQGGLLGQLGGYSSADYATQAAMLSELEKLYEEEYAGKTAAEQQSYENLQAGLEAQLSLYDPEYLRQMQIWNQSLNRGYGGGRMSGYGGYSGRAVSMPSLY